jgi:hypothetical protein
MRAKNELAGWTVCPVAKGARIKLITRHETKASLLKMLAGYHSDGRVLSAR